jgi:SEC-C motif-containing protein
MGGNALNALESGRFSPTDIERMQHCHCGSGQPYSSCCAPYIEGEAIAPSAEALMRSRYSAYVEHAIDYLGETLHPEHRADWDRDATRRWSEGAEWLGLQVVSTEAGQLGDTEGWVEFIADFKDQGKAQHHHERSRFLIQDGRWYYVDGEVPRPQTRRHEAPKVGRNDPCPCGSGKKFKKCCGA